MQHLLRCIGTFLLLLVIILIGVSETAAEIKVFEKVVEEIVGKNQSQEQIEAFALQKAKRLAVEEAGTYISSLTVVKNYQLAKDEITALASGIVKAKIVGVPSVSIKNGVIYVKVTSTIQVDTSILVRQIEAILKEKGTLKKLEEERLKVKELEDKLANLKRTELKRIEALNQQAITLEIERDKQRVFREEQRLKAQGDIAKAELEILRQEKDRIDSFENMRKVQEAARIKELEAIAKEKDRIKKAQLENESYWKELARNAETSRANWIQIDDTLSLKQAVEEAENLISEIATIEQRLDSQSTWSIKNLKEAYGQQIAATRPILPPDPAPKDAFETTAEYNERIAAYKTKVQEAENENREKVEKVKLDGELKIAQLDVTNLEQRIKVLEPFIQRLEDLQSRKFILPEIKIDIALGEPEADNFRFPLFLKYNKKKWTKNWEYSDRNQARAFWETRTHITAQGMVQLERSGKKVSYCFTASKVSHAGTKEDRVFELEKPKVFDEILRYYRAKKVELAIVISKAEGIKFIVERVEIDRDGNLIAYSNRVVKDTISRLEWFAGPERNMTWNDAKAWVESLNVEGGGWRMPTREELKTLYQKGAGTRNMTPLLKTTGWWVWSGETTDSASAWNLSFLDCSEHLGDRDSSLDTRGFAVRSQKR